VPLPPAQPRPSCWQARPVAQKILQDRWEKSCADCDLDFYLFGVLQHLCKGEICRGRGCSFCDLLCAARREQDFGHAFEHGLSDFCHLPPYRLTILTGCLPLPATVRKIQLNRGQDAFCSCHTPSECAACGVTR
jgi:hypothetical protein